MVQLVDKNDFYRAPADRVYSMIDNYLYMYHTDTLVALPTFPESLTDQMAVQFSSAAPMARSAPIYSYSTSGPRTLAISLPLHRDMMNEINVSTSNLKIDDLASEDYIDKMIKELQAIALPVYGASEKMVDPPIVAIRFGVDIFCKGIVQGPVTVTYSGPILRTDKYAQVTIDFTVAEIDPYDANTVMTVGGFRGLSTDLERRIWKTK